MLNWLIFLCSISGKYYIYSIILIYKIFLSINHVKLYHFLKESEFEENNHFLIE